MEVEGQFSSLVFKEWHLQRSRLVQGSRFGLVAHRNDGLSHVRIWTTMELETVGEIQNCVRHD